jgi:hypothetical protein
VSVRVRPSAKLARILVAGASGLVAVAFAAPARADVSSWLFVGSGPSRVRLSDQRAIEPLSLQFDAGLGSPPSGAVAVGGLLRLQPYIGHGSDLALLLRTATRGFNNGTWGGALDLGGYERWWGPGSAGATASFVLGGPWGLTLSIDGTLGSNAGQSVSAVFGVDLARLTIYRGSGLNWWENPFPVGSSEASAAPR